MTIGEVSKKVNLSIDTLRYYERVGLIPPVHRSGSGLRDYNDENLRWVEFIKCMRGAGLPIEALIEYVRLFQEGDASNAARKDILIEQRAELIERMTAMQMTLDKLNIKIDHYELSVREAEKKLRKNKAFASVK